MKDMTREQKVAQFYAAAGNIGHALQDPANKARVVKALSLIHEEFAELEAVFITILTRLSNKRDPGEEYIQNAIKELADLAYVVSGFAVEFGIDLDLAFNLVHRSNLTKLDDNGVPHELKPSGKIAKGPFYAEPDMAGVAYATIPTVR